MDVVLQFEGDNRGSYRLLRSINEEHGTAIVMVTHNRSITERYPGRIFEIKDEKCEEKTV